MSKKVLTDPKKQSKRLQNQYLGTFSTLFLTLRAGRLGKTLLRLSGDSGLGGVETPVYGDCNRKATDPPLFLGADALSKIRGRSILSQFSVGFGGFVVFNRS